MARSSSAKLSPMKHTCSSSDLKKSTSIKNLKKQSSTSSFALPVSRRDTTPQPYLERVRAKKYERENEMNRDLSFTNNNRTQKYNNLKPLKS